MIKTLKCSDIMPGCDFVVRAWTEEALLEKAAAHAQKVHRVQLTQQLADKIRTAIRVEQARGSDKRPTLSGLTAEGFATD
ncbi:DUF1059 domain-containing protein [Tropicimonas sp. IMCC34043]|uniref:DUF1059 domain-containing protein n=1 Tax=Tropicimonas sp. IMCC34043 TaxID=2248760 RepID=UPI0018E565BA|nr:DUF1059 domain-containing protein [Tropicimonas sp. IMCC34043]